MVKKCITAETTIDALSKMGAVSLNDGKVTLDPSKLSSMTFLEKASGCLYCRIRRLNGFSSATKATVVMGYADDDNILSKMFSTDMNLSHFYVPEKKVPFDALKRISSEGKLNVIAIKSGFKDADMAELVNMPNKFPFLNKIYVGTIVNGYFGIGDNDNPVQVAQLTKEEDFFNNK